MRNRSTWRSWDHMMTRCNNARADNFHRYGGRGITVCERWRSFDNFLADMGERPEGTSLDRIDNSKGYEPRNCRWATPKEQSQNRRSNRLTEAGVRAIRADRDEGMSYTNLGKKYGISTVAARKTALGVFWPNIEG